MTAQLSQKLLKPTVAALNGRFHRANVKDQPAILRSNRGNQFLAGESIWPYTKTPPLPQGLLTAGAVEIKQHTPALSIPTGGWGRSSETQVCPVSHQSPKPEIAFSKQFSITAHPKKGNEDYTV